MWLFGKRTRKSEVSTTGLIIPRKASVWNLNGAINAAFGGSVSYIRIDTWYIEVDDANKNNLWCYPGSPDGR